MRDFERAQGDLLVGFAEHDDRLGEGRAGAVEAGLAAGVQLVGELAAEAHLTGVAVVLDPHAGVARQLVVELRPHLVAEGGRQGLEGALDGVAGLGAPHRGDLVGAAAALIAAGAAGAEVTTADAEDGGGGDGGEEGATVATAAVVEGAQQVLHRREPVPRVLFEAAQDRGGHPRRHADVARRGADLAARDGEAELVGALAGEGELAEQGLVERGAEAELIGGGADGLAEELLRGHIRGRADDLASGPRGGAGEAEIEHADAAVVADHGVARLEVAVDEAGLVRRREAAAGLNEGVEDLGPGALLAAAPGLQGLAADELHGDEDLVVVDPDLVDDGDVGVRDLRHRLRLVVEAQAAVAVGGALPAEDLERDLAIELGVVGGVDDAHLAGAEVRQDGEATDLVPGLERDRIGRGRREHTRTRRGRRRRQARSQPRRSINGRRRVQGGVTRRHGAFLVTSGTNVRS
ncbi:MAG TPA: hypothetical protein VIK91_23270 [Nannocystis sp.]